jgi:hypothetical protein
MANEAIITKIEEMMAAPSCCAELKEAGRKYLDAVGTKEQKEKADMLVAELKEDVCALADVREFFASEAGAAVFGKEKAAEMTAIADAKLAAGETVCFCPACQAGNWILEHQELLNE